MDMTKQVYVTNRTDWRAWLEENFKTEKEVWLIHYKKHTGKPSIPYEDAVEEALCFGWIDGLLRRIDDEKYIIRYSPRQKKSIWSDSNKRRIEKLIKQGRMTEAGLAKVKQAKENGEWDRAMSREEDPQVPPDLKKALVTNRNAMKNFYNFAPSYRKQYTWWITSAKKGETRAKRIQETVNRAAQNMKPGIN